MAMPVAHLICGDARSLPLPDGSVHCIVTSPPYWGLRNYGEEAVAVWGGDPECNHRWVEEVVRDRRGTSGSNLSGSFRADVLRFSVERAVCRGCGAWRGQMGMEPVHDCLAWARGEDPCPVCYICHLRAAAREMWRVLRSDGTLWLVIGDSYATTRSGSYGRSSWIRPGRTNSFHRPNKTTGGLKEKDLALIPHRTALALQADGWYVRSDIIYAKSNAIPESVSDRPVRSHEHVLLLTKSSKYFYDRVAVLEPYSWVTLKEAEVEYRGNAKKDYGGAMAQDASEVKRRIVESVRRGEGRNARDVWWMATEPYTEAHFAVFPTRLVERCIRAGTPDGGVCSRCGAPWRRVVARETTSAAVDTLEARRKDDPRVRGMRLPPEPSQDGAFPSYRTLGWEPACGCRAQPRPAVVLDPFCGSGTTGLVALRLGRDFYGVDLVPRFVEMARRRILDDAPLLNRVHTETRLDPSPDRRYSATRQA